MILLLSLPLFHKHVKPDENALSIAQTNRMFSIEDAQMGDSFVHSWANESDIKYFILFEILILKNEIVFIVQYLKYSNLLD